MIDKETDKTPDTADSRMEEANQHDFFTETLDNQRRNKRKRNETKEDKNESEDTIVNTRDIDRPTNQPKPLFVTQQTRPPLDLSQIPVVPSVPWIRRPKQQTIPQIEVESEQRPVFPPQPQTSPQIKLESPNTPQQPQFTVDYNEPYFVEGSILPLIPLPRIGRRYREEQEKEQEKEEEEEEEEEEESKYVKFRDPKYSTEEMKDVKKLCINRYGKDYCNLKFPVDDSIAETIIRKNQCRVPRSIARYRTNARDDRLFPCVDRELMIKKVNFKRNPTHHIEYKDIVWYAAGNGIPMSSYVYPTCRNLDCFLLDHLQTCTSQEQADIDNCLGTLYYVEYTYGTNVQKIYKAVGCKDHQCHQTRVFIGGRPIIHPFSEPTIHPKEKRTSADVPVMRLTAFEAKRLFESVARHIIDIDDDINKISDEKIRDKYIKFTRCIGVDAPIRIARGDHVVGPTLHLDKSNPLYETIKSVAVKDLVWRASDKVIPPGKRVVHLCGNVCCIRYDHLVLDIERTGHDIAGCRTRSCGYTLLLKNGEIVDIVEQCKHTPKCKVVHVVELELCKQ